MKRAFQKIATIAGLVALSLGSSWAQKIKSQKEQQAILAVQVAKDADERIKAIENVLTNFADTEFKVTLLQMALQTEEQKNDYAQMVFYGERLLKADPKNTFALVTLASETARHTRENDLDKDEQLKKVDQWAKEGIEAAKTMPKMPATESDEDLDRDRKSMQAQAYVALGMADALKKNADAAVNDYKQSLAVEPAPNGATYVRLAQVYMNAGKLDDAEYTLDKALAIPNVPEQVKSIANTWKADIAKAKAKSGGGAAPAASPAPAAPPAAPQQH
ncbi:MAG TPA: tetratricopeptide repeat protein [Bryobacteraceae bacterium]|nr:tetratricopeptide repeat protein [Bryobacteraceae bacterium]